MSVPSKGNPEDDTHHPVSSIHDGDDHRCGGDHHHEKHVSCEAKSHCGKGCCADDEKDSESSVYPYEDPCCGHDDDDHCVDNEDRRGTGLTFESFFSTDTGLAYPDICCPGGLVTPKSGVPRCCKLATDEAEAKNGNGKCIPNGTGGCQRAALLKSTCCGGSSASFIPGMPDLWNVLHYEITQDECLQEPQIPADSSRTRRMRSCSGSSSRSFKNTRPIVSFSFCEPQTELGD